MTRGFTLLEVLLALAVTALVMTAGLVAVRATAQRIGQVETTLRAEWALENLRQELLLEARPPEGALEREEQVLGQAFVTRARPLATGGVGLTTVLREQPRILLAEATLDFTDGQTPDR